MPFDHQSPQYVSSNNPPFTQQQRMLNTFQNIPQVIVSNEEEDQPIVGGTEGEEERIENMGNRYQQDNDIEMEREWEHGRTGMEYGGIEYRSTGMGNDEQNDGRTEEYHMSSSEDDDSNGDGDSYSDSSLSSIDIDELISRHLTNVPKIGMITMGTVSSKESMVAMDTLPSQNRFGSNKYFQRFDHRSRVPVYPSANRNNPYRMGVTTNIPFSQHPLSQSYNSNR